MKNLGDIIKLVKKLLLFIIIFAIALIFVANSINNYYTVDKSDNLVISYKYDINKEFNSFNKAFRDKQVIVVENNSDKVKVISLKWKNVNNALKCQNKFVYEVRCNGNNCKNYNIVPSQVPITDFILFTDIILEPNNEQIYIVTFKYGGCKDKNGYFKGQLVVEEGINNQDKYDNYMKERTMRKKQMQKIIEEYQKLDDK